MGEMASWSNRQLNEEIERGWGVRQRNEACYTYILSKSGRIEARTGTKVRTKSRGRKG